MEQKVNNAQDKKQNLYDRSLLEKLGIELKGSKPISSLVLFEWNSIKRFAPYLVDRSNNNDENHDAIIVIDWIAQISKKQQKHPLIELSKLASYSYSVLPSISEWDTASAENRGDAVNTTTKIIDKLITNLENSGYPISLFNAMQYFSDCCEVFNDQHIIQELSNESLNKKTCNPYGVSIIDLLNAMKAEVSRIADLEKLDYMPNAGFANERILAREVKQHLVRNYRIKTNPNAMIAALVRMIFRNSDIDSGNVQNWLRKDRS